MIIIQQLPNETKLHKNGTEKKRKRPKRKVWKRKINFRRKNFGNLEEWDPDPQMKKVGAGMQISTISDSVLGPKIVDRFLAEIL